MYYCTLKVMVMCGILYVEVNGMELLQLRYFCEAARCENFSQTAKRHGVPPSDVSQSVKRLERELGETLFDREVNRLRLNSRGRAFWERVEPALTLLEEARVAVRQGNKRELHLAINVNRRLVMQAVDAYRRQYADVDIVIRHGVDPAEGGFDLLIAEEGLPHAWERREILSEEIMLAVAKHTPLAAKETIDADDLRACAFITMGSGSNLCRLTEQICRSFDVTPRIALQSDDPFYIRRCVDLGLGVAFVPSVSWQGQFPEGIVLRRVGGVFRHTCVYWREETMRDHVRAFLGMLVKECKG